MKETLSKKVRYRVSHLWSRLKIFAKWLMISGAMGLGVGLISCLFYYCMQYVVDYRKGHPGILFGLPLAGLAIVFMYEKAGRGNDRGTNTVLAAIRTEDEIPVSVAPLIFVSTVITHLFGGSSGREGAALQLGGSIGSWFGRLLHMDRKDINIIIMCGMSAAFSALFGTPMAAAIFSMEVVSVGIMYYAALVPCVFSALIAQGVAKFLQIAPERFTILEVPQMALFPAVKIVALAALCGGISVVFCILLHKAAEKGREWFPNPYLRIIAASIMIIVPTLLIGSRDYLGAGMEVIERSIEGHVKPEAFVMKMLFTAVTLGAGFKGGEIVPSFFVGATFGCLAGQLLGISPSLCAAVGMVAVFCGVTNSPITSLLIAFELFGFEGAQYFLLAVAVSYMLSGYYGLYQSQKIVYSKYKTEYLDRLTRK